MAVLSITAANVQPASNAVVLSGTAGATLTAGQCVYILSSDSELYLTDADVLATAVAVGILLNGGSDTQPVDYIVAGEIDLGATLTVGQVYAVSTTTGAIALYSDLGSGDYVTILGVATATDNLLMGISVSNTAKP